jgi:hypothetical protein
MDSRHNWRRIPESGPTMSENQNAPDPKNAPDLFGSGNLPDPRLIQPDSHR